MKSGKIFVLTGAFLVMTSIANAKLPGYTDGAELMQPNIENGQIDSMSGIIYSQVKGLRSIRAPSRISNSSDKISGISQ